MARSYDIAILSQKVEQMEGKIVANDVIANPTGETSADLTAVQIDGTKYKVSNVAANPAGDATGALTKVTINGTTLDIKDLSIQYDDVLVTTGTTKISDLYYYGQASIDTSKGVPVATVASYVDSNYPTFCQICPGGTGLPDVVRVFSTGSEVNVTIRILYYKTTSYLEQTITSTRSRKKKEE